MAGTNRGRRWRRQRLVMRALVACALFCLPFLVWRSVFPALALRIKTDGRGQRVLPTGAASPKISRPIYPYSIIRGGAYSRAELIAALERDPVASRHYLIFRRAAVRTVSSTFSAPVFLSYRVGNAVYWTSRAVRLPAGETLLTDGQNYARTRCGNRISATPQAPVNDTEPAAETMNTPQPPANTIADLNNWTENGLMPDGSPWFTQPPGQRAPVSTVTGFAPPIQNTQLYWSLVPTGGLLPVPEVGGIPRTLFPGGATPVIEPNPIPGLVLPPAPIVPAGYTPGVPPTLPAPITPVGVLLPPNILPPEIWPPSPTVPIIPGLPPIPIGPGYPGFPVQEVPEPGLAPVLHVCAALALTRLLRRP